MSPLAYRELEGRWYIVGSAGGQRKDPGWVHNLRANPKIKVEVGTQTHDVEAKELCGDERAPVWSALVAVEARQAEYQSKSGRVFPLFELAR